MDKIMLFNLTMFTKILFLMCFYSVTSETVHRDRKTNGSSSVLPEKSTLRFLKSSLPAVIELRDNEALNLTCEPAGPISPNLKIDWLRNNYTKFPGDFNRFKWSLTKKSMGQVDYENYTCILTQGSQNINHTFKVIKKESEPPVKVVIERKNITVELGDLVNVTCKVEVPSTKPRNTIISWSKTFKNCTGSKEPPKNSLISNHDNTIQLQLHDVTKEKEGWYTCSAHDNIKAYHVDSVFLKVIGSGNPRSSILKVIIPVAVLILVSISISIYIIIYRCNKNDQLPDAELGEWISYEKEVLIKKSADTRDCLNEPFRLIQIEIVDYENPHQNPRYSIMKHYRYKMPEPDDWEFPRQNVEFDRIIGEGEFGEVHKAFAHGIIRPYMSTVVAIKKLKAGHDDMDMKNLVSELEIMKMIGKHDNIINLLGCCTQRGDLLVITEFASRGNLLTFLRGFSRSSMDSSDYVESRPKEEELIGYLLQIAKGMEFLAEKKCVHRDLAARNVLVDENFVMKIADFGLARTMDDKNYYSRKTQNVKLPFKWMAPETFTHNKYTWQSDV